MGRGDVIEAIEIRGFRGIVQGTLEGLFPLTLLMGKNNSGKSTCLEAFWLTLGQDFSQAVRRSIDDRGKAGPELISHIAPRASGEVLTRGTGLFAPTEVTGAAPVQDGLRISFEAGLAGLALVRRLERPLGTPWVVGSAPAEDAVTYNAGGGSRFKQCGASFVPARFVETSLATKDESESLSSVQGAGENAHKRMLERMQALDPGIREIRPRRLGFDWVVHMVYDDSALPFAVAGDGVKRFFHLACILGVLGRGVVLLEEPECYQHPGALRALARLFWSAIEAGTQIICSTHSIELFDAIAVAARAQPGRAERFGVFRMALREGSLVAARITGERAMELREEMAEDLRS
jgi:energy-coupling factor transporter ATP-binding protein EcfA2